jgi:hypothetical protein
LLLNATYNRYNERMSDVATEIMKDLHSRMAELQELTLNVKNSMGKPPLFPAEAPGGPNATTTAVHEINMKLSANAAKVGLCTSWIQFTHSLKAPGIA